jgi:hypothetical protein
MSALVPEFLVSVTWSETDFVALERYFGARTPALPRTPAATRFVALVDGFGKEKWNVAGAEATDDGLVPLPEPGTDGSAEEP